MLYASDGEGTHYGNDVISSYVDIDDFKAVLLAGISQCSDKIDISKFNIPSGNKYENAVRDYIWYALPEAFNAYGVGFYTLNSKLMAVSLSYRDFADTPQEYNECYNKMLIATNKILKGIEGNSELGEVEKALLLHDRLALWNEYDYERLETGDQEIYTAYGALGERASVCQGYAMAYMYLLNRVGIKNYYCSSQKLVHGWNIVYIDGKPYHVDVTWDDMDWGNGKRGLVGGVDHDNFLRSNSGIYSTGHIASDYDMSAVYTTYDEYFWQDSEASFELLDDEIYYIDNQNKQLKRYSDKATLLTFDKEWLYYIDESRYYNFGNNARLACDGEALIYSTQNAVYKYDVASGNIERVYNAKLTGNAGVYGMTLEGGYLICDINDVPPYVYGFSYENVYQIKVEYDNSTITGDSNNDGEIDNKDYAILMQYLNGWNVEIVEGSSDVNGDGSIDNKDYALLMQFLNGWDVTLK